MTDEKIDNNTTEIIIAQYPHLTPVVIGEKVYGVAVAVAEEIQSLRGQIIDALALRWRYEEITDAACQNALHWHEQAMLLSAKKWE